MPSSHRGRADGPAFLHLGMRRGLALLLLGSFVPLISGASLFLQGSRTSIKFRSSSSSSKSENLAALGSTASDGSYGVCSCDCCQAGLRRPDEAYYLVNVKCQPSHDHGSDSCGDLCMLPPSEGSEDGDEDGVGSQHPLLLSALGLESSKGRSRILDFQRFCFLGCGPSNGPSSPVGTQCVDLVSPPQTPTLDNAGNPKDPAVFYTSAFSPSSSHTGSTQGSLLSQQSQFKSSQKVQSITSSHSKNSQENSQNSFTSKTSQQSKVSQKHQKVAASASASAPDAEQAEAANEVGQARAEVTNQLNETNGAIDEILPLKDHAGTSPLDVIEELRLSVKNSVEAKESALEYARAAVAALRESQKTMWEQGSKAAEDELASIREEAKRSVEAALKQPQSWQDAAREATDAASAPYLEAVERGLVDVKTLRYSAEEAARLGREDEEAAAQLRSQVGQWESQGMPDQAQDATQKAEALEAHAKELYQKAHDLAAQSEAAAEAVHQNYTAALRAAHDAGASTETR
mmetsp:Transcript_6118/g.13203  ORF Transcript_6118/g.13203 Transcript_6118/m.13203 type:complete len:518 (+) Transcript_6118:22-1575(+)|eukprot:CAMPEP_0206516554 /NCGR_PEP_ID=MMETSP0324_2-20121206/63435_1 /ASSEMBLY_ACC=CAM_ASM_000836 /TAXON_ID=2866 /ORGANISM="Crypthecodinium cohnii, Strain Seligo" /LENGTH=517 /DNA_ID=CAMNT_0054009507 /DNA_START=263 /DNA_END=1816 /DNA_ORIENTATION=+